MYNKLIINHFYPKKKCLSNALNALSGGEVEYYKRGNCTRDRRNSLHDQKRIDKMIF